ncbi:hypothetical protein TIFTF001_013090 [Ficus carica]|uniref:Uncharacterized protein n=1 Tax=Ficus carica TaxID=3494 RepID=A0AA88APC7_FICCA|nr:hypothetical protein TIFTF001_013090 [Ficus carica]
MACYRSFELDISSFERYLSDFKTTLYAVVSIVTPSSVASQKAVLASCYKENLTWEPDRKLRFLVEESKIQDELATLMIRLRSRRTFMIDEAIGHVGFTPLKKLLDDTTDDHEGIGIYHIIDIDGNLSSEILSFAYKFSEPLEEEDLIIISSSNEDEDENGNEDGDGDEDDDD